MKKENNKELEIIKKEISPVQAKVSSLVIKSGADMTDATEILSRCNKYYDSLKIEKEKITKPLNAVLKEVRGRYKPIEDQLDEIITTIKGKMGSYQQIALQKQEKEEQKIADKVASGKMEVGKAIDKLGEMDSPEEKVKTDEGSVSFKTVKKFEVMDLTLLPVDYLLPNEVAIRKAKTEGIELAGVRYYEEQSVINRRN